MGSALTFLQDYWEEGNEFLDRIVTFVNTVNKKIVATVFWNHRGIFFDRIHGTRDHINVRGLL